jgi:hypothetical protein
MATTNLSDEFSKFVSAKEAEKDTSEPAAVETVVETEEESWLASVKSKVEFAWWYLRTHTPKPLRWMVQSLGWVLVGTIVAAAAAGASYFLLRYLVWYLILQLGKWLLERIGRGIPRLGLSVLRAVSELGDVNVARLVWSS